MTARHKKKNESSTRNEESRDEKIMSQKDKSTEDTTVMRRTKEVTADGKKMKTKGEGGS